MFIRKQKGQTTELLSLLKKGDSFRLNAYIRIYHHTRNLNYVKFISVYKRNTTWIAFVVIQVTLIASRLELTEKGSKRFD